MVKTSEELLDLDISYCGGKFETATPQIKLSQALDDIKSDRHKKIIEELRADLKNKEKYKNQLDGYIFTGTFSRRGSDNLIKYSHLCVLDFDHLTYETKISLRNYLQNNKFVFAYWDSPGGGYKGLIYFDYSLINEWEKDIPAFHKMAFYQFSAYFDKEFNNPLVKLDQSGNDVPRLCYSSYDPN